MSEDYYKTVLDIITGHWDLYLSSESDDFPRKGSITCLGDLSSWLSELLERGCPKSAFIDINKGKLSLIYPKILTESSTNTDLIAKELQAILPDAPEVRAILPVLITGYIMNRRGQDEFDPAVPSGATALYRKLHYGDDISNHKSSSKSIFRVCSWEERYPDVTFRQMTRANMKRHLSHFGMVNLFRFLAYKMKELCNLTLSCALFEEFAGYPGYCDDSFPRLEGGLTLHTTDDPLKDDISLYLEKLYEEHHPDGRDGNPIDKTLDRYIVFCLDALHHLSKEPAGDWSTNKWAEEVGMNPQAICYLKMRSEGICSDEMLEMMEYSESPELKAEISECLRADGQIKLQQVISADYALITCFFAKIYLPICPSAHSG